MSTLYELTKEYLMLLEMADDPEVDDQAFEDTLEGLGGELELKADSYAKVIEELKMKKAGVTEQKKRFERLEKSYENKIQQMKNSLEKAMNATGKRKFKTDTFNFWIQKNPKSVKILDDHQIPPEFIIIKQEANKSAIKEALKAGEAFDWAVLEQTEGLRIR